MRRSVRADPNNRWPWLVLILGLIVIAVVAFFFAFNRPNTVNVNLEGTSTPLAVARPSGASPGPPPTLQAPTSLPSATLTLSPTPLPSPSPTARPSPSPSVAPTPAPAPPVAGATQPAIAAPTQAAVAAAASPIPTESLPTATPQPSPSPTPFTGQVSKLGGVGNTRQDVDAAYGAPIGETPEHLVVYRKNGIEYHVGYVPDLNGRAALEVVSPQATPQALPLAQAQSQAHNLLPIDAQPPNPTPEGNAQFVVERYTSQRLAQAFPAEVFSASGGAPGQLLIVYVRDAQGRITRWMIGSGNDPNALLNRAGR